MILIDGKKAAAELREELKQEVAELKTKYNKVPGLTAVSYTHLRAHETLMNLVCRLLLEKK